MNHRRLLAIFSVGLFLAALPFAALTPVGGAAGNYSGTTGLECLFAGWLSVMDYRMWPGAIAWLANPVYLFLLAASLSERRRARIPAYASVLPLVLASGCFAFTTMVTNAETDAVAVPVRLGLGAYLWLASLAAFAGTAAPAS
ncbi:MAG: hypothetical protein KGM24_05965 [Elusimicrobia bacterium]|nr:hypothetical protein [Elusimicrobiota bacterium]